jgi:hypothetical protein
MFLSASDVLPYVQIAAGSATAAGFIFIFLTFKRTRKTEQTKLAEKANETILNLDKELAETDNKAIWYARLFNNLEWYSFLVNENQITDDKIKEYFKSLIISHYERTFMNDASQDTINDPDRYQEFKKLYRVLKDNN